MEEVNFDPRFQLPFTALLVGTSGSGKSFFVKQLIENMDHTLSTIPDQIIWCYSSYQSMYDELSRHVKIKFNEGISESLTDENIFPSKQHTLLIVDDLLQSTLHNQEFSRAFTEYRHHQNLSVIFFVLFYQGKCSRTISLNTNYFVLFKSLCDKLQIRILAQQMFPGQRDFFLESFNDATKEPYSYLVMDVRPQCPEHLRLRSGILPHEWPVVYQYKRSDLKMSKRIKRNLPILKPLVALKPSERRSFLCCGSQELLLCEIALNVLKGHIPLTLDSTWRLKNKRSLSNSLPIGKQL